MTILAALTARQAASAPQQRIWRRLPLVLLLLLGMMVAMVHCADDSFAGAGGDHAIELVQHDAASHDPSDASDHQGLAHSGHCLSHATAEQNLTLIKPELMSASLRIGRDLALAHHATPPLFKPPRA